MRHHLIHFFFICAFIVAGFAPAGSAGLLGMSSSLLAVTLLAIWLDQDRLLEWLADSLVARSARTPYFNLRGYMQRDWLVPYNTVQMRTVYDSSPQAWGTGPVGWNRPVAKVMQLCGVAVRVHQILRSDSATALHNHPFWYLTIVLRRGYWEHTEDGRRTWYGPGSIIFRRATFKHRLELEWDYHHEHGDPIELPATTLFITGQKKTPWGFFEGSTFIPHEDFRGRQ